MLKDERIVVIAELRSGFSEEAAFSWMSQVLQAVDSIHQVSLYALALVPQNHLPRVSSDIDYFTSHTIARYPFMLHL